MRPLRPTLRPPTRRGAATGRSEAAAEEEEPDRPRGGRGRTREPAETPGPAASGMSALDWTRTKLAATERLVFERRCAKCHVLTDSGTALPAVAPPAMPTRWFPHSVFDHGVHRPLACTECHAKAAVSKETGDVLLPGIAVCRECHRADGGARANCAECHVYHDRAMARDLNGPLTIREITADKP